jgi:hypothetical protein
MTPLEDDSDYSLTDDDLDRSDTLEDPADFLDDDDRIDRDYDERPSSRSEI